MYSQGFEGDEREHMFLAISRYTSNCWNLHIYGQFGGHYVAVLLCHFGPWDSFCEFFIISSASAGHFPLSDICYFSGKRRKSGCWPSSHSLPPLSLRLEANFFHFLPNFSSFTFDASLQNCLKDFSFWNTKPRKTLKLFLSSTLLYLSSQAVNKEMTISLIGGKQGNLRMEKKERVDSKSSPSSLDLNP